MNRNLAFAGVALIAMASLASPAFAQNEDKSGGVYVSASAGVVFSDDQLINGANAAGAPRRIITDMDKGTAFDIALGYATRDAEPPRVCRRLFVLSCAAMGSSSSLTE